MERDMTDTEEKTFAESKKIAEEHDVLTRIVDVQGTVRKFGEPKREMRFLEQEDRLTAENLQLRVMNISLQEQNLVNELGSLRTQRTELQQQLLAHRDAMSKKYNIDFNEYEVRAGDGAIMPKGSTTPGHIR